VQAQREKEQRALQEKQEEEMALEMERIKWESNRDAKIRQQIRETRCSAIPEFLKIRIGSEIGYELYVC